MTETSALAVFVAVVSGTDKERECSNESEGGHLQERIAQRNNPAYLVTVEGCPWTTIILRIPLSAQTCRVKLGQKSEEGQPVQSGSYPFPGSSQRLDGPKVGPHNQLIDANQGGCIMHWGGGEQVYMRQATNLLPGQRTRRRNMRGSDGTIKRNLKQDWLSFARKDQPRSRSLTQYITPIRRGAWPGLQCLQSAQSSQLLRSSNVLIMLKIYLRGPILRCNKIRSASSLSCLRHSINKDPPIPLSLPNQPFWESGWK